MKIESNFTIGDVKGFMDGYLLRERDLLASRLERIGEDVGRLAPLVRQAPSEDPEWNAHEILAHIAVVAKFYGVMVHRIASGRMTEIALVDSVNLRDVAGSQTAQQAPEEIAEAARADITRTAAALRSADAAALRRTARIDDGTSMTAEEVARFPLVTHLEAHVDDLKRLVAAISSGF